MGAQVLSEYLFPLTKVEKQLMLGHNGMCAAPVVSAMSAIPRVSSLKPEPDSSALGHFTV